MPNNKERVCIIGGGPAGLSCAMYLEKKGYTNYTIYEKLNKASRVGLDYWDEPDEFFVFERKSNLVHIQYFEKVYPVIEGRIQQTRVYDIKLIAEAIVPEELFFNTVKTRVNEFWTEVGNLNTNLQNYIEEFKI